MARSFLDPNQNNLVTAEGPNQQTPNAICYNFASVLQTMLVCKNVSLKTFT